MATYLQGYLLMIGLIMPIGMQNTFVLTQGIRRQHHYLVAGLCALLDLIFVSVAVYGIGHLFLDYPIIRQALFVAGSGFLITIAGGASASFC